MERSDESRLDESGPEPIDDVEHEGADVASIVVLVRQKENSTVSQTISNYFFKFIAKENLKA